MPWGVARKALDALLLEKYPHPRVSFFGGEPLLAEDLLRRAVHYVEDRCGPDTRPGFRVTTNGTLLNDSNLQFLEEHEIGTMLSFDGVPAAQTLRGPNTFDRLDDILVTLARHRPEFVRQHLDVRITVSAANLPFLADSVHYLASRGVSHISISPLLTHDPQWSMEMIGVVEDQIESIRRLCSRAMARGEVSPVTTFRSEIQAWPRQLRGVPMCGAVGGKRIVVDVDGGCYGCSLFAGSLQQPVDGLLRVCTAAMRIGDIHTLRVRDGLPHYRRSIGTVRCFSSKEKKYSSLRRCGECEFINQCVVCPASIGFAEGNFDGDRIPDIQCAFNYAMLNSRKRLLAEEEEFVGEVGVTGISILP